ncbi:MAG: tetratricopeptide repeat protein [Bryobacterales bacterium]|nr:tetratricopeptide repeat protein [Bryobacterales bacterium]
MTLPLLLLLQISGLQLYEAGRFAEARDALLKEVTSAKATPETHFWLGYAELAVGNRPGAIQPFEAYLKANPRNEDVLYALTRTYAQLAEMSLERIFALDPKSARAYQMRGIRFELEREWPKAIDSYETALKLGPEMRGVWSSIARIHARELNDIARSRAAAAREARQPSPSPGIALVEKKQPRDALPHLLEWRAAQPRNADVYYYLGEAYTDLKVDTIQRLRAVNPSSYRLHQVLAESYASTHRRDEAIEEYRQVLRLRPGLPGVQFELARLLTDSAPAEARTLLEQELRIDPDHFLAKSLLGQLLVALHESEPAVPLLESALAARDSLAGARKALGKALVETGKARAALDHLLRVAREDPDDEEVHFVLARAYRALGLQAEAAREMTLHQQVTRKLDAR